MFKKYLFLIPFLITYCNLFSQDESNKEIENIIKLIEFADDNEKPPIEKLSFAESAKRLSEKIGNDTLKNQALRYIALNQFRLRNYNLLKKSSQEYLSHSIIIRDSSNIARANIYLGQFYLDAKQSDSAYFYFYNAEKIYKAINDDLELGNTLRKIAIIQKEEKDLIGSEVSSIEAITLLEPLDDYETLSALYNNLGIIYNELGDYNKAIDYHEKALEIKKKFDIRKLHSEDVSINNLGYVYREAKQYENALEKFSLLLENKNLKSEEPEFYVVVLDNYAYTKFLLNQTEQLPGLYYEALKVCDSIDRPYRSITIYTHLSEFYSKVNQLDSTKYYAYKAKDIAKGFHADDYLKTLLYISEIEEDSISVKYYQRYIKLNDSLINNEREVRNKFARIRYETRAIEERNERITKERLLLLILSIGLLLTIFLTYSTISQRAKNKELKLKQLQQEANEEIYNLMLSQQDKIEEGRAQEKKRVSEELHDGILGRLFGTRLSLDSLNTSNDDDAVKNRSVYIEELKAIEQEIRQVSHDLNRDFVEDSGYFDIIRTLVENQTLAYNLTYNLKKDDDINWESVSNKTKINLYRIVQETLHNIYKHANAKQVVIRFDSTNKNILLEIRDDGIGFEVNKARKGIGLKNLQSRAEELKGELIIKSKKEHGTTIQVRVPK